MNLAFYWGLIPFVLAAAGIWIDHRFRISPVPAAIGVPLGVLLIGAGALLAAWATVTLYLRGGGFPIALLPPKRLVRAGPYGFSRHPLYFAFCVYTLGGGLAARSVVTMAFVPVVLLVLGVYAAIHEERVLVRRFGDEYASYRKEVPFFFRVRRGVLGPGIVFSLSYILGKPLVRLLFPIRVVGKENLPQSGPAILIANHASYLDPFFVLAATDRYVRFLTKSEVMQSGLGKWFFTCAGSIPTGRYRIDPASVRELFTALNVGEIVGIFPEGERTWDGRPLPVYPTVKRLLARAGVPIIPVRIEGSYALYPRWAGYPLPGSLTVRIFPPVGPDAVDEALTRIAVVSDGQAWLPRSAHGIELVLWACPVCHTIGSIEAHGRILRCVKCETKWKLDHKLRLRRRNGDPVTIGDLAAAIPAEEILRNQEELTSIGRVDVLAGGKDLVSVVSGVVTYRSRALWVGNREFPLEEARILRLDGKNKLDIGFPGGERLRLRFHRDSPLKWQKFLGIKLGIS